MKKYYFLVALFAFAILSMNAQIDPFEDDMESYPVGQPISQDWWTDWGCGGGAGCAIISSAAYAFDGSQSGLIPGDGTTDAVLDLGNKIFDVWGLAFYMYIPAGKEGYFNLQGEVPIGAGEWAVGNIYFNQDGLAPGQGVIDDAVGAPVNFTYPEDTWFRIVMNWNIENGISLSEWEMSVANVMVIPEGTPFTKADGTPPTSLGGIDFYSGNTNHLFYMDTFDYQDDFIDLLLSTDDFSSTGFRSALNNNILTLQANEEISNVSIYNMLGQEVYASSTNTSSVNMSSYANGTYIVKVNIAGTEGTVKIVK